MKYKVNDRVRIKSIDWYNENKDKIDEVVCGNTTFIPDMVKYCEEIVTISAVLPTLRVYHIKEDGGMFNWTDEMIEGLVEEEDEIAQDTKAFSEGYEQGYEDGQHDMNEWVLPEGYLFTDENGNVINATKIVLEKKHNDKLKLESTKKIREYWSEYARIFIEIYDDEPNECVLTHLYTIEGHRQKGYGRQALSEAEEIAKELGCHTAYLKVETNSWIYNWYLRCGYTWYKNADKGYTWLIKNL